MTESSKPKSQPGQEDEELQGEGNYRAARRYNEAARKHAQEADVEAEAREAEPTSSAEARELEQAEEEGRQHAKDENPLLERPEDIDRDRDPA
jgi:hypothetical protein